MHCAACPPGCKNSTICDDKTEKGLWVYVKYFQLGAVEIPSAVEDRFQTALTLKEDAEREKLLQEAQVVRKSTEAEVEVFISDKFWLISVKIVCT